MVDFTKRTIAESVFIEQSVRSICGGIGENGECHLEDMPRMLEYYTLLIADRRICFIDKLSKDSRIFPQIDSDEESDGEDTILYAVCYGADAERTNAENRIRTLGAAIILVLFSEARRKAVPPDISHELFSERYPVESSLMEELIGAMTRSLIPSDVPYEWAVG